jgi:hypothetical protein
MRKICMGRDEKTERERERREEKGERWRCQKLTCIKFIDA